jgi:hypothetical protein
MSRASSWWVVTLPIEFVRRFTCAAFTIDYRVRDTEHRATLRNVFRVCLLPEGVPVDVPGGRRCPAPTL